MVSRKWSKLVFHSMPSVLVYISTSVIVCMVCESLNSGGIHRVALITDVSKMYRAIELNESDKDLHRFVWRTTPNETLRDYRMTRVTFGVSASSFAANMSVRKNAADLAHKYPLTAKAVDESFYVDDGLTGADSTKEVIELQKQLQDLFSQGGFLLHKWNSTDPAVLQHSRNRSKTSTRGG